MVFKSEDYRSLNSDEADWTTDAANPLRRKGEFKPLQWSEHSHWTEELNDDILAEKFWQSPRYYFSNSNKHCPVTGISAQQNLHGYSSKVIEKWNLGEASEQASFKVMLTDP
jgi:hypothetical protein